MIVNCPKCNAAISAGQMNVATDVAACSTCNEIFQLSSILQNNYVPHLFDINVPPKGLRFEKHAHGWYITATTRSKAAFFLIPFMCIWSGVSLGGIYGSQIASGKFNLVLSLFGIPFLIGSIFLGSITLMAVCGKVVVSLEGKHGKVFTGIGPIGRTRKFDWSEVETIEEDFTSSRQGGYSREIALVGKSRMKFGSMLSDSRGYFLLQALRSLKNRSY
jgi:hypothetical protein